jgi:hypothetical protein
VLFIYKYDYTKTACHLQALKATETTPNKSLRRALSTGIVAYNFNKIRGSFGKFVDWRRCAAVMQREAVTVMPICDGRVT